MEEPDHQEELDALDEFTSRFTKERILHERLRNEYYAPGNPPDKKARLEYMTTRLGIQRGKTFRPSIPLLDWLGTRTNRRAFINEQSAWLFICGKNVLKEGIISNSVKEGSVMVLNEREEVLGYGRVTGAGITNALDRGDYLRRER